MLGKYLQDLEITHSLWTGDITLVLSCIQRPDLFDLSDQLTLFNSLWCLFVCFEIRSKVAQVGLELSKSLRMVSNFWSSSLFLPSVKIKFLMCICLWGMFVCMPACVREACACSDQRTTFGNWFSPSTVGSSDGTQAFVASAFYWLAIASALEHFFTFWHKMLLAYIFMFPQPWAFLQRVLFPLDEEWNLKAKSNQAGI